MAAVGYTRSFSVVNWCILTEIWSLLWDIYVIFIIFEVFLYQTDKLRQRAGGDEQMLSHMFTMKCRFNNYQLQSW